MKKPVAPFLVVNPKSYLWGEKSLALAKAADDVDSGFIGQAFCGQNFFELFLDLIGMAAQTTGTAAKDDMALAVQTFDLFIKSFGTAVDFFIQGFN